MAKKSWRIIKSLDKLLTQLNAAFPKRSKVSDGGIGDANHSARTSDHNPNEAGLVCARDSTHDPKTGIDCNWLAETLIKNRDPRIKYIIWNKRILSGAKGPSPWVWRPYKGVNGHTHHLHLSVNADADNATAWKLDFPNNKGVTDIAKISTSATPAQDATASQSANKGEQTEVAENPIRDAKIWAEYLQEEFAPSAEQPASSEGAKVDRLTSALNEMQERIQKQQPGDVLKGVAGVDVQKDGYAVGVFDNENKQVSSSFVPFEDAQGEGANTSAPPAVEVKAATTTTEEKAVVGGFSLTAIGNLIQAGWQGLTIERTLLILACLVIAYLVYRQAHQAKQERTLAYVANAQNPETPAIKVV